MLHLRLERRHAPCDLVDVPVRILQYLLNGPALRVDRYLRDQAETLGRRYRDLALVAGYLADEDAEKRRFAAAVVAEDADALSAVDRERQTVQYVLSELKGFDQ